jgi:hypothetical protein
MVFKRLGEGAAMVAEGTAIGATRCAVDNNGGIVQDVFGVGGGIVGATTGGVAGSIAGEVIGELIGKPIDTVCKNAGEWLGEKISDVLYPELKETMKKPSVVEKKEEIKQPQIVNKKEELTQKKPPVINKKKEPEEKYYCKSCRSWFWASRSTEIRRNWQWVNRCPKCGSFSACGALAAW